MEKTLVSIIVPVYNVELYIKKALDSLINQTFKDIEIICVNDGSTDNSYEIMKEYANKDSRIVCLNQENQGVSIARNSGLNVAKGTYIMFADPDDWLELDAVEQAYNAIIEQNVDVLRFGYYCYVNETEKYKKRVVKIFEDTEYTDPIQLKDLRSFVACIWDKIYKKEFIVKNQIKFPQGIKGAEDGHFCLQCVFSDAKWGVLRKNLYNYRVIRKGSAMDNVSNIIQNEIESLYSFFELDMYKNASPELKAFCLDKYLGGLLYQYKEGRNRNSKFLFTMQLIKFVKNLNELVPQEVLQLSKNYERIKKISFLKFFIENLFSLRNEQLGNVRCKLLIILGLQIRFRKRIINE